MPTAIIALAALAVSLAVLAGVCHGVALLIRIAAKTVSGHHPRR